MSRIRRVLTDRYADHYARVNAELNPESYVGRSVKDMELMYGSLISSLPAGSKVLDLGCGTGLLLHWLSQQPGIIPVGVDSSISQVEHAKQTLPDVDIFREDGLKYLQTHPDTFAGIFCLDVLEHIPEEDLLEWVETARSALQAGGFLFCRAPNAANLAGNYGRYIDLTHQRSFTSASMVQLFETAGFRKCRIVPIRSAHIMGNFRLNVEYILHRILFRIVGYGLERVFTRNICAVAFKV